MTKGKSGSFRANSLTASDLSAMENHELRNDLAGEKRSVRKGPDGEAAPPLLYDPYGTGLTKGGLVKAHAEHIDGARVNKAASKIARHAFLQFPTDLDITPETEQMMLDQAVEFVNQTHGGQAVFRGRLDRDEKGRHGVDVFFATRYAKTTKHGKTDWISLTKFGKERAVEIFGQKPLRKKNNEGEFKPVEDDDGNAVMVDCDSQYYQGRAFQLLWFEHLRDRVGLDWVERGKKKLGRDQDRLEVEEYKFQQEREKLDRDRVVQNEDMLEAKKQARETWEDASDALDQLYHAKDEARANREQAHRDGLKDAKRSIQAEIDQRWAKHEEHRSEAIAEVEERAWERVKYRIDELVTERASERLQNAEVKAKAAIKREKVLKRTLAVLWTVLRSLFGREDLAAIKTAHKAELSKPAKEFKLSGPEGP
jgi:hypothetical protein